MAAEGLGCLGCPVESPHLEKKFASESAAQHRPSPRAPRPLYSHHLSPLLPPAQQGSSAAWPYSFLLERSGPPPRLSKLSQRGDGEITAGEATRRPALSFPFLLFRSKFTLLFLFGTFTFFNVYFEVTVYFSDLFVVPWR